MSDDITEKMIEAWNEPYSSEHDPRELLVQGAREIRRLRRELTACAAVIQSIYDINARMADELRARQPNPNVPVYLMCALAILMAVLAVAIVL